MPKIYKTPWRERLIFNTIRRPFPYLLHRWSVNVVGSEMPGWTFGSFRRKACEDWVFDYYHAPIDPPRNH